MRSIDHPVIAFDSLDEGEATFEALGFTLTPRAHHMDAMGTSNRLAQFAGKNFIELLEVDRPDSLVPHALDAVPPKFSFGAHNRAFLQQGGGMSMLALTTSDARADLARFEALGLDCYAPFYFERQATLPDGQQVTVAFSLGFVTSDQLPGMAFFICQQHAPEFFWKPQFQSHANGARAIEAVYIAADEPDRHVDFLTKLTEGHAEPITGGQRVSFGGQALIVLTPSQLSEVAPGVQEGNERVPRFAGLAISVTEPPSTRISEAGGLFVEWRPA